MITPIPIIQILVVLVIIGVGLWLVNTYIPMQPVVKQILNVVVVLLLVIWLLKIFGIV
jgi:hypothetical protein